MGKLRGNTICGPYGQNEAQAFTPWLAEHLDVLGDALGITIELEERESSVGTFSLDILARDQDSGEAVVIENQIEQSDHEHLGKLITYASGKDAKYIVWIVKDAREEHRAAIEWMNKISDDTIGFFNPLFCRVILLENTNKPARRIFDRQFCGLVSISFWHQLSNIAPRGGLSQSPILHASSALVMPPWVTVETRSTMAAGASFMPPRIHSSVSPTKAYL